MKLAEIGGPISQLSSMVPTPSAVTQRKGSLTAPCYGDILGPGATLISGAFTSQSEVKDWTLHVPGRAVGGHRTPEAGRYPSGRSGLASAEATRAHVVRRHLRRGDTDSGPLSAKNRHSLQTIKTGGDSVILF